MTSPIQTTRRNFVKSSAAIGSALAIGSSFNTAYAQGGDTIKVALVGCGGRGTGAVAQQFRTKGNVKLVAVADALQNKAEAAVANLSKQGADKVLADKATTFWGMDAYKKAIDSDCDVVVIATPPGFKPLHFEYAVNKGKHIFCEKPIASDAEGCNRFMNAVQVSKQKKLMVGIGLQRRHETHYKNIMDQIHNGAIGDLINTRVYWNGGGIWFRGRENWMSDMQYECNNWYHFIWSCGDQIVEQHIHNLDVGCWAKNMYPVKANGMGGWGRRLNGDGKESQIFDHTFVEYTFPDGTHMYSQGRHLRNSFTKVGEIAHGTKGNAYFPGMLEINGQRQKITGKGGGHQQEQHDLIETLMAGKIYNEGEVGVRATFTAILGREACYSGKEVTWDKLWTEGKNLCPGMDDWTINTPPPARKNADGVYDIPKPGIYSPYDPKLKDNPRPLAPANAPNVG